MYLHIKFREDPSSGSRDVLADRQTHTQTDRQTDRNIPLPYWGGVIAACLSATDSSCNYLDNRLLLGNLAVKVGHVK